MFNSFDPSPFHERDLDSDAEEYIVGSAEEVARHAPLCLVFHLPADQLPNSAVTDLGPIIHNYFAYRAESERRRLRLLFHDGRIALATGLAFLFCCVLVRELAFSFLAGAASDIVAESMLIIGWSPIGGRWKFSYTSGCPYADAAAPSKSSQRCGSSFSQKIVAPPTAILTAQPARQTQEITGLGPHDA